MRINCRFSASLWLTIVLLGVLILLIQQLGLRKFFLLIRNLIPDCWKFHGVPDLGIEIVLVIEGEGVRDT